MGQFIQLISGDGVEVDFWHEPAVGRRKGCLILVMEIFGVTDHIRDMCARFAKEGYEVLSPALYDRLEKNFTCGYTQDEIQKALQLRADNTYENTVLDCQAAIDHFRSSHPTLPVFITGFCYGGSVTWICACRCRGLSAASGYYGSAIKEHVQEDPQCPTILHFGQQDEGIPITDVHDIDAAHSDVTVHVYDAGHGFQSDRRSHYNEEAAGLAMQRTLSLFMENGAK